MLHVIRGLPGSGKSTLAFELAKDINTIHLEADMWFTNVDGYKFDKNEIRLAHKWCVSQAEYFLRHGKKVVVSNTFVTAHEVAPYYVLSKKYGVILKMTTLTTQYGSIHDVPKESINKMRELFMTEDEIMRKLEKLDVDAYKYDPYSSFYDRSLWT